MTVVQPELGSSSTKTPRHALAIVDDLGDTMFVEAGAGSGKTKSLVDRVVALVTHAGVPMREIAAVTFTEKAAAELRDRIRRELEQVATSSPLEDAADAARARAALDELDGAAVSTLHAFAQRLLSENPIEAGLPPRIEVLDDIGSQVAFEDRWTRFVDLLLDDPALERALLLALNADTGSTVLRTIALACNANWDLVQERMGPEPDPPPLASTGSSPSSAIVCALASACADPEDKLALGLGGADAAGSTASNTRPTSTSSSACSPRVSRRSPRRGPEGQLAVHVRRGSRPGGGHRGARARRGHHRRGHRGHRPAPGVGDRAVHLARGRRAPPERPARIPRPAGARPLGVARSASRLGRPAPPPRPLHPSPARRVPRHRSHPVRPRRAPRVGRPQRAASGSGTRSTSTPAVCSSSATPSSRSTDSAAPTSPRSCAPRSAFGAAPRHLTRNFRTTRRVIEFVNHVFRELIIAEPESQPEYVALDPDSRRRAGRARPRAAGRRRARARAARRSAA